MRNVWRDVAPLSAIAFLLMLGIGAVSPILPLFAESFGVSYGLVGAAISAFAAARVLFDLPGGALADRFGGRAPAALGLLLIAAAAALMGNATSFALLVVSRFFEGLGSALFVTVSLAYLAETAEAHERGKVMSTYVASLLVGGVLGPLIGGFLASEWGVRVPFFLYSASAAACAALAYATMRGGAKRIRGRLARTAVGGVLGDRTFATILLTAFALFFARVGVRRVLLPLFAEKNLSLNEFEIGAVLSVAALAMAPTMLAAGHLSDKYGRKSVLYPSLLLTAFAISLLPTASSGAELAALAALYGVAAGLSGPLAAFAADVAPPETMGLAMGVYRTVSDAGFLAGPLVLGLLAELGEGGLVPALPFYFASALLVACAALLTLAREPRGTSRTNLGP